jgi:hypothetical protein
MFLARPVDGLATNGGDGRARGNAPGRFRSLGNGSAQGERRRQYETLVQKSLEQAFFRNGQGTFAPKTVLHVPDTMRHSQVYEQPPLRSVKLGPMALAGDVVAAITAIRAVAVTTTATTCSGTSASADLHLLIIIASPIWQGFNVRMLSLLDREECEVAHVLMAVVRRGASRCSDAICRTHSGSIRPRSC